MTTWFTSDWHLGDNRLGQNIGSPNLLFRPYKSADEGDNILYDNIELSGFQNGDVLYHLGDVEQSHTPSSEDFLFALRHKYPDSKFILVRGNYDTHDRDERLKYLFNEIHERELIIDFKDINDNPIKLYLSHYPLDCLKRDDVYACITGHIHSLWKLKMNKKGVPVLNVGVDAWHLLPVHEYSVKTILNGAFHFYDENVFFNINN